MPTRVYEDVKVETSILPQTTDTAVNGTAIDLEGYGEAVVIVSNGAVSGSPSSYTFDAKVQESADGSTSWTDITDAEIVQVTADDKTGEIAIEHAKRAASKRYIRVVATAAITGGTSPLLPIAAHVLLGRPERAAVGNSLTAD